MKSFRVLLVLFGLILTSVSAHAIDIDRLSVENEFEGVRYRFEDGKLFYFAPTGKLLPVLDPETGTAIEQIRSYAGPFLISEKGSLIELRGRAGLAEAIPIRAPKGFEEFSRDLIQPEAVTEEGLLKINFRGSSTVLGALVRKSNARFVVFPTENNRFLDRIEQVKGRMFTRDPIVHDFPWFQGQKPARVARPYYLKESFIAVPLASTLAKLSSSEHALAISSGNLILSPGIPSQVFAYDPKSNQLTSVKHLKLENGQNERVHRIEGRMILSSSKILRSVVQESEGFTAAMVKTDPLHQELRVEDCISIAGHDLALSYGVDEMRRVFEIQNSPTARAFPLYEGLVGYSESIRHIPNAVGWQIRVRSILGATLFPTARSHRINPRSHFNAGGYGNSRPRISELCWRALEADRGSRPDAKIGLDALLGD